MKTTPSQPDARSPRKHRLRSIAALSTHLFLLVPFAGCGDDSVGLTDPEPAAETTGATGPTEAPSMPTTSTTTGDVPTTGDIPTDDTSTTEELPTTGDESTTGSPTGCHGLTGDGDDDDDDGVANKADNCPCEANPNQLDFDGNTIGNVCDLPLKFTVLDGDPPGLNQLTTTAYAKKALECEFAVDLVARDGVVEVLLDDSGTASLYLSEVDYIDTPELDCELGPGISVKLRVQQFFAAGLDPFTVGFPFTLPDHQAGTLIGVTDAPHKILASAIINVTQSPNQALLPTGEEPLADIPGVFPTALVSVSEHGQQISLTFADDALVLFEQTTDTGITFKLTGLTGTLHLQR